MKKSSALERAYSWVRERILDGTLPSGSYIDEATVCEATGVSRTPAREAFNRLEGERFITLIPRKGAQVRSISSSDLLDAFHARFMIESFTAAEFCDARRAVPEEMLTNLAIMDSVSDFATTEDTLIYINADRAFHAAFVQTLNNRPIFDFFESLWRNNSAAAINRGQMLRSETWLDNNQAQHRAIVAALTNHDRESVIATLRAHLK
ncbi:GntR family transcriptional regulator [Rhizobium leguminosarum]|uniref:GntR family transcriptional regulator n=1 Tax=Rhizobium leguminosarum TaxID=384 RepID=UPI00143F6F90|nr:GntR family transcriptional regulator [Rhizobium leguminosarum]NKL21241.1 FCD domain-containing protein [Rhizobium leguminosarum bv. viciae]NKL56748.1 FCD domain-containing protein [Rhizobium leguminosarum bv. viciae]